MDTPFAILIGAVIIAGAILTTSGFDDGSAFPEEVFAVGKFQLSQGAGQLALCFMPKAESLDEVGENCRAFSSR